MHHHGDSQMSGFVPPPYPYERLDAVIATARTHEGGAVDLSIGTPSDPTPTEVIAALSTVDAARSYPPSIGTGAFRDAAAQWIRRRFGVPVDASSQLAACVGTKEFVASVPQYLHLRDPSRDTVLYPAISYPTYEMGAILAGCRPVPYSTVDGINERDARRALCIWVNSPNNPTGQLHDVAEVAEWARRWDVPAFSDECYAEYVWQAAPSSILQSGVHGVVAVHSLSKRDNFAGARIGFYAGDPELVQYLRETRKHAGLMPPGPVQAAAVLALRDDAHVAAQRERYLRRLRRLQEVLAAAGYPAPLPQGTFYLWVRAPDGDSWAAAHDLAVKAGIVVSPGEFYGQHSAGFFRVAAVAQDDRIELAARRVDL